MSRSPTIADPPDIPEIIQIVLIQATRPRESGAISWEQFDHQLKRLISEELLPRGLSVSVEKDSPGHSRFVVKDDHGTVRQFFEC